VRSSDSLAEKNDLDLDLISLFSKIKKTPVVFFSFFSFTRPLFRDTASGNEKTLSLSLSFVAGGKGKQRGSYCTKIGGKKGFLSLPSLSPLSLFLKKKTARELFLSFPHPAPGPPRAKNKGILVSFSVH